MRHGATILWAMLATVAATGLFLLKYQVQAEEQRLHHLQKQIVQTKGEIHILQAEWSYLNEPTRLRELAELDLKLEPIKPIQIATIDSFPLVGPHTDTPGLPAGHALAQAQSPQPAAAPVALRQPPAAPALRPAPPPPVRAFDVKAERAQPTVQRPALRVAMTVPARKPPPPRHAARHDTRLPPHELRRAATTRVAALGRHHDGEAGRQATEVAMRAVRARHHAPVSEPTVTPTYADYPSVRGAAPAVLPASGPGNVMVITSPALSGGGR